MVFGLLLHFIAVFQTMWEVTHLLSPFVVLLCAFVAIYCTQQLCFIWWTNKVEITNTHSQSCCLPVKLSILKQFSPLVFVIQRTVGQTHLNHIHSYHPTIVKYDICTKCTICMRLIASQIQLLLICKPILNSFCNISGILAKLISRSRVCVPQTEALIGRE